MGRVEQEQRPHPSRELLREGPDDFFAVFVRVLEDGGDPHEVEPGVRAGDYLHGFLLGTRAALHEAGRQSLLLTLPRVDAPGIGALIALFERAVGLYASLIGINAYHQPGVEAGKRAAGEVLALQGKLLAALSDEPLTVALLLTVKPLVTALPVTALPMAPLVEGPAPPLPDASEPPAPIGAPSVSASPSFSVSPQASATKSTPTRPNPHHQALRFITHTPPYRRTRK